MITISHKSYIKILRVQLLICKMNTRDDLTIDLFIERQNDATYNFDDDSYEFNDYDEFLNSLMHFIEYAKTRQTN